MSALAEFAIAVGHEENIFRVLLLLPDFHDIRIVDRQTDKGIDPIRLECIRQLVETWQMSAGAGRREGAGQREKHDRFTFEQIVAADFLPLIIDPDG